MDEAPASDHLRSAWPAASRRFNIIAASLEQPVIEKILMHLGLQTRAPPRTLARGQTLQAA